MKLNNIKIKKEYLKLVPRPNEDDYQKLKNDIKENGIEIPVIVNSQNVLLEGFTRYNIAKELSLSEIPTETKTVEDELSFIIRVNVHRRHLSIKQKTDLGLKLLDIEREKAKQRQSHGQTAPGRTLKSESNLSDKGRATKKVAEQVGVSEDTMKKAVSIDKFKKNATPEEIKKFDSIFKDDEQPINKMYQMARKISDETKSKNDDAYRTNYQLMMETRALIEKLDWYYQLQDFDETKTIDIIKKNLASFDIEHMDRMIKRELKGCKEQFDELLNQ